MIKQEEIYKKISLPIKVYAILNVVYGIVALPLLFVVAATQAYGIFNQDWSKLNDAAVSNQAFVLTIISMIILVLQTITFIVLSFYLLKNNRRLSGVTAKIQVYITTAQAVVILMLNGVGALLLITSIEIVFLLIMYITLDPALHEERILQRHLIDLENKSNQEDGTLGRDKTGKGYVKLNFFNLFWLFMIAAFIGFVMESIICPFLNGRIENRTGVLYGFFSPIYGFGAIFMLLALNRLYNKNEILICVISGLIGGFFEYIVSWFFQFSFGIVAWDYSNELLNFSGRTSLAHMFAWGLLGLIFIKLIVPRTLKIANSIPWKLQYTLTAICATLMIINGAMTLMAFQCWYDRKSGVTPDTPVAEFYASHYGDDFMEKRFQTMSIDPSRATRSS